MTESPTPPSSMPPRQRRWVRGLIGVAIVLLMIVAAAGIVRYVQTPSNGEVRDAITRQVVSLGGTPAQARCVVDELDARFDLTSSVDSLNSEEVGFIFEEMFGCMGAGEEMSKCLAQAIDDHFGGPSGEEIVNAVESIDASFRRSMFVNARRCLELTDEQIACTEQALLERYPGAFDQATLTAEQNAFIQERTTACVGEDPAAVVAVWASLDAEARALACWEREGLRGNANARRYLEVLDEQCPAGEAPPAKVTQPFSDATERKSLDSIRVEFTASPPTPEAMGMTASELTAMCALDAVSLVESLSKNRSADPGYWMVTWEGIEYTLSDDYWLEYFEILNDTACP